MTYDKHVLVGAYPRNGNLHRNMMIKHACLGYSGNLLHSY